MKNRAGLIALTGLVILFAACGGGKKEAPDEEKIVNYTAAFPVIGEKMPRFELESFQKGKIGKVKSSDYKGKWLILFFYPADFTFVCPTELKEMTEYYKAFRGAGAEVLAISTDSVYVHKAWHEHNADVKKIPFPMLSDRAGKLARALGTYLEEKGVSIRASFVVDPDGVIVACEFHDESIGRSAPELLRKLEAAVAVRDSDGGFCPAGWKPGDRMIKPK